MAKAKNNIEEANVVAEIPTTEAPTTVSPTPLSRVNLAPVPIVVPIITVNDTI